MIFPQASGEITQNLAHPKVAGFAVVVNFEIALSLKKNLPQ